MDISPLAIQEWRKLAGKYERLVKKAYSEEKYGLVESYLEAMLKLSPNNKKLQDSLRAIQAKKASR